MNVTSQEVRKRLQIFDTFFDKQSKKALLRDRQYWLGTGDDLKSRVHMARMEMASDLHVTIEDLPYIHTGNNGRYDCDNYSIHGCSVLKAQWDAYCRENPAYADAEEYAIWPMSRADMPHTQAIALTKNYTYLIEFIDGNISLITERNKPKVLLIG